MIHDIQGLRVLLVEDDTDSREIFELLLRHHGAEVRAEPCAADALNALRRQDFDVLLSDIQMPGQDGCELLRRVRMFDQDLPALALTGCTSSLDQERAFEAGFDAHVSKPVSAGRLVEALVKVCGERATRS